MDRLQNAPDESARSKIVEGLLKVHQRQFEETRRKLISENRLGRVSGFGLVHSRSDDPDVRAFHKMVRDKYDLLSFVRLPRSMSLSRDMNGLGMFL